MTAKDDKTERAIEQQRVEISSATNVHYVTRFIFIITVEESR